MKVEGISSVDITNSINRKQINEDQGFETFLRKAYSDGDKEKLKEACRQFEGLLLQMMYRQMKKTVPKSELMPESQGRKIFEDMLDEEIIFKAADKGIGIADMLYRQMSLNLDNIYVVNDEWKK